MKVGGAPLDEDKIYRVAILDFLARGGDDYTMFRDAQAHHAGQRRAAAGERGDEYLRKLGTVRTGVEGRIAVK